MTESRNRGSARAARREPIIAEEGAAALDLESRLRDDHHQSVRLWLRLLSCTNIIAAELRRRLREQFDCTLSRFDLMAQLERAPEGLSMSEISRRMMVTNAAITGLAERLVKDGHVERSGDAADRRAVRIRLTPAGRDYFLAMAHRHEAWVVELFSGLSETQKGQLRDLTAELKTQLRR
ncbi:MarR family transcriptional regulator [Alsobacter sp. SYSU M60028]|uniref:MarR family transcriptional regulator n=1 Tax=Alsobacter ponti TaxID=2962936 RepID=A0ABT1LAG3_9HYPH|nr:MarR family transcriptional regulator [Alsobacter ponti]MCP8937956.1 MarR family transcriptional regulator [Alsobacter ponti]